MDKKIFDLLQELIEIFAQEQHRLEQNINKGIEESVTNAEVLAMAKELISNIVIVKRAILMLQDVQSMSFKYEAKK
jgi:hypothetical protein